MRQGTKAIHAGRERDVHGALSDPVYRSVTFGFDSVSEFENGLSRLVEGHRDAYLYSRFGNPTTADLARRLAALEGAEDCLVTSSGMGAIAALVWTFLRQGDHVLADTSLYGDTHTLFDQILRRFGAEVTFVDFSDLDLVSRSLRPSTRMVYFETPCNPTLKVIDITAVAKAAHAHDPSLRVVVDSTFASPFLQTPLALGADLVVHSVTKYLGGHGDALGGCICGPTTDISKILLVGIGCATGAVMAPDNAFLVSRGLATLSVRMERHCQNALAVAKHLQRLSRVAHVYYPGLTTHPGHGTASRQMTAFGGMVSFELQGTLDQAKAFVNKLKLVKLAVSLGGVQSLIVHPASMTHVGLSAEALAAAGITATLVRMSVGIEDIDDILEDLDQASAASGPP
jgi:methionine-gamma-lyase